MLHATMSWPGQKFIDLWSLAILYAVWIRIYLPPSGAGWSPDSLWSLVKQSSLSFHELMCLAVRFIFLTPNSKIGRRYKSWIAGPERVFFGFSPNHSTLVSLVPNPHTQHISPQYHAIFDDMTMVLAISTELFRNQEFERIFEIYLKRYLDPLDACAQSIWGMMCWNYPPLFYQMIGYQKQILQHDRLLLLLMQTLIYLFWWTQHLSLQREHHLLGIGPYHLLLLLF